MTFQETLQLGNDIVSIMKAMDDGLMDNCTAIRKVVHAGDWISYYIGKSMIGGLSQSKYDQETTIRHHSKIVHHRQHAQRVCIFHDGEIKEFFAGDPILTPTEEQYFQNSLVYGQDSHLRIFLWYGLLTEQTFKHNDVMIDYTHLYTIREALL